VALGLVTAGIAAATIVVATRATGGGVSDAAAARPSRDAPALPPRVTIAIHDAADARAAVARAPFAADLGVTPEEVASTRELYRFDDTAPNFTAGLSAYWTPLAHGGFCISFAAGVSCSRTRPSTAEPLMGIGLDPDAERSGEPFVVISMTAPGVRSVSYTCAGATYPATFSDGVAVFVSPSSSLRADDCTGNAIFANGAVVSKHI
jgi:hypothetical protein